MTVRLAQIGIGHVQAAGKTAVARETAGTEPVGIFEPDARRRETRGGAPPFADVRWFETAEEILDDLCLEAPAGGYEAGWQTVDVGDRPRYVGDLAEFAHCIATGAPPRVSYDHDLLVHEVLLRACGVAVEGQPLEAPAGARV